MLNYGVFYNNQTFPAFKKQAGIDNEPQSPKPKRGDYSISDLIGFLSKNNIFCSRHSITSHILPEDLAVVAKEVLTPVVEKKEIIKQILKLNNRADSHFNNFSDKYEYVFSIGTDKTGTCIAGKATDKHSDKQYKIVFDKEMKNLVNFFEIHDLKQNPELQRSRLIKKIRDWEKVAGMKISHQEQEQLLNRAINLQNFLDDNGYEISWLAVIGAVKYNIEPRWILQSLKKSLKKHEQYPNKKVGQVSTRGVSYEIIISNSDVNNKSRITSIQPIVEPYIPKPPIRAFRERKVQYAGAC